MWQVLKNYVKCLSNESGSILCDMCKWALKRSSDPNVTWEVSLNANHFWWNHGQINAHSFTPFVDFKICICKTFMTFKKTWKIEKIVERTQNSNCSTARLLRPSHEKWASFTRKEGKTDYENFFNYLSFVCIKWPQTLTWKLLSDK